MGLKHILFRAALVLPALVFGVTHWNHCSSEKTFFCNKSYGEGFWLINAISLVVSSIFIFQSYQYSTYQEKIYNYKYQKMQQIDLIGDGLGKIGDIAENSLLEMQLVSLEYYLDDVNLGGVNQYVINKLLTSQDVESSELDKLVNSLRPLFLNGLIEKKRFGYIAHTAKNTNYASVLKQLALSVSGFAFSVLSLVVSSWSCEDRDVYARRSCHEDKSGLLLFGLIGISISSYFLVEGIALLSYKILFGDPKSSPTILIEKDKAIAQLEWEQQVTEIIG